MKAIYFLKAVAYRVYWFLNGRVSSKRVLRKEIRKWWQIVMWSLVVFVIFRYIFCPLFDWWDGVISHLNNLIWG